MKMNNDDSKTDFSDKYDKFLQDTLFRKTNTEKGLEYRDPFVTKEQKKRDEYITKLLGLYVSSYNDKVKSSKKCRTAILCVCLLIVVIFAIALVVVSIKVIGNGNNVRIQGLIAFISACVSFVSSIIGLLTIITKYFFPKDDEKYITTIVESIQRNDLENKKENANHQQSDGQHKT